MKFKLLLYIFIFSVFVSMPVLSGDIYKYIDENGTVIYTDDLSRVPDAKRKSVAKIPGSRESSGETEKDVRIQKDESLLSEKERIRNELEKTDKELQKEYTKLKEMKDRLAEKKKSLETKDEKRAYYKEVQKLNEKISDYKKRYSVFEEKVSRFNKSIKAD